jgi:hypothetical protein
MQRQLLIKGGSEVVCTHATLPTEGPLSVTGRIALVLVERESTLREVVADVLRDGGLESLEVDNSASALELLSTRTAGVVVVYSDDRNLILALGRLVPVVAIVDPHWHWTAEDLGIRCVVPLVFDVDQLQRAVRDCLAATVDGAPLAWTDTDESVAQAQRD